MATSNSPVERWLSSVGHIPALLLFFFSLQVIRAQTNPPVQWQQFVNQAERNLLSARAHYQREPTNAEAAWQFGRACFERAEFATNDTERATLAVEGIDAMRRLLLRAPKLAAAHYYLAMNLGQFARTKLIGALRIVDEMEREFKLARELDEWLDFAGPDRNLGQLYFQAPGWPASIGNRAKARRHMERSVELVPGFPDNPLNLLEAHIHWKDEQAVRHTLKAVETLWPTARTNFSGQQWVSSWSDWEKRRQKLLAEAVGLAKK